MSLKNRLTIVAEEDIPSIVKIVEKFLPEAMMIHGFLSTGFKYKTVKQLRTKVYTPEAIDSPFFIVITSLFGREIAPSMSVYWSANSLSRSVITDYLCSLPGMNWKHPFLFAACEQRILDELAIIMGQEKLSGSVLRRYKAYKGSTYWMGVGSIPPTIELPDNFELGTISQKDAGKVLEFWEPTDVETEENIVNMVTNLPSSVVYYRPEGSSKKEMVAWTLTKHSGDIGMTHTLSEFRRKKFASIVTSDLARKLQKLDIVPNVIIDDDNYLSIDMHEKIGFVKGTSLGFDLYQNPNDEIINLESVYNVNFA